MNHIEIKQKLMIEFPAVRYDPPQYRIVQRAASTRDHILFELEGSDKEALKSKAEAKIRELERQGVPIVQALRKFYEILPACAFNIASGSGRQARKVRKMLREGQLTGLEQNVDYGRGIGNKWMVTGEKLQIEK